MRFSFTSIMKNIISLPLMKYLYIDIMVLESTIHHNKTIKIIFTVLNDIKNQLVVPISKFFWRLFCNSSVILYLLSSQQCYLSTLFFFYLLSVSIFFKFENICSNIIQLRCNSHFEVKIEEPSYIEYFSQANYAKYNEKKTSHFLFIYVQSSSKK